MRLAKHADVLVLGAGAAGLVCAWRAALGGRKVTVLDHADLPARKVRISGGGRCNLTNRSVAAVNYACANPHFVKSSLARFSAEAVLELASAHNIRCEERTHGRMFCCCSADNWADSLVKLTTDAGAELRLGVGVESLTHEPDKSGDSSGWRVRTSGGDISARSVVVALGGPAWPQTGASNLGHTLAQSLGLKIAGPRPSLAPLLLPPDWQLAGLSGISLPVRLWVGGHEYHDDLLFTHGGVSGPAALQASLRWDAASPIRVDFLPDTDLDDLLANAATKTKLKNLLAGVLPARLTTALLGQLGELQAGQVGAKKLRAVRETVHNFTLLPKGVADWRKAEVTAGGVDTNAVSSKTMEAKRAPGVYFVGEVLDVTGELGGYNLHWAFASGYAAGEALAAQGAQGAQGAKDAATG